MDTVLKSTMASAQCLNREETMKGPKPIPVKERLLSGIKIDPDSGCWLWQRGHNGMGYGQIGIGSMRDNSRRGALAHRVSYEIFKGSIPNELFVLHKCDAPRCVNPDHLFPGTQADNMADKLAKGRHHYAKRTHCFNGHLYAGDNLIFPKVGGRGCRTCERERDRKRRNLKREGEKNA